MNSSYSQDSSSHFIQINEAGTNLKLHYNDIGSGDNVIVMLHGSGAGATSWGNFIRNIDPFVNAGYRLILLDCPGWGESDSIICSGSRPELNARCLKAVMDGLNIDKVHIIGNSMGAHTAVAFALAHPDSVNKLVLMGGGTGGISSFVPAPSEGIKVLQEVYRYPSIDNLKKAMSLFVYNDANLTEDLFIARLENILAHKEHLKNFTESFAINPKQFPDVSYRLGEILAPTFIIWGREDRVMALDSALRLLAGIPNANLHVFGQCGHWAQWEHANTFNQMVLNFLE